MTGSPSRTGEHALLLARPLRCRCDLEAELQFAGASTDARVVDLSMQGAFVQTDLPLQVGDQATLVFGLREGPPMTVLVTVVRTGSCLHEVESARVQPLAVQTLGVGVRFERASRRDHARLSALLDRLEQR